MTIDLHQELHKGFSSASAARRGYVRKAYEMLPRLDRPRILDIGCGRGGPTLELARLSSGEVIGLDIDQPSLDELAAEAERAGLSDRVRAVKGSMLSMEFPAESFDIIWSEGSIQFIGFEQGLSQWRRLLKPRGYLVVHVQTWLRPDPPAEMVLRRDTPLLKTRTAAEYMTRIPAGGYELVDYFALPDDFWWHDYYLPLQERIIELRRQHAGRREGQEVLEQQQREIDVYRNHAEWAGSAYFSMQRRPE